MLERPRIETARLILRMAEAEEADAVAQFYNENREHLKPWRPTWKPEMEDAIKWEARLREYMFLRQAGQAVKLFIFPRKEPDRVIGLCNLNDIVRGAAYYCVLGYGLAELEQGKGLMAEALGAAIEYAFGPLNLHRVRANYVPHNTRSGALLKRLGFVAEGYARDYLLIDGRWQDHVLTSLINSDWAPPG